MGGYHEVVAVVAEQAALKAGPEEMLEQSCAFGVARASRRAGSASSTRNHWVWDHPGSQKASGTYHLPLPPTLSVVKRVPRMKFMVPMSLCFA